MDASLPTPPANHRSRRTAQDTTRDAAKRLGVHECRAIHLNILELLSIVDMTDPEIHQAYYADPHLKVVSASTLRARRSELMHANMVRDTGKRGRSETGRPAIVWGITPIGIDTLYFNRRITS